MKKKIALFNVCIFVVLFFLLFFLVSCGNPKLSKIIEIARQTQFDSRISANTELYLRYLLCNDFGHPSFLLTLNNTYFGNINTYIDLFDFFKYKESFMQPKYIETEKNYSFIIDFYLVEKQITNSDFFDLNYHDILETIEGDFEFKEYEKPGKVDLECEKLSFNIYNSKNISYYYCKLNLIPVKALYPENEKITISHNNFLKFLTSLNASFDFLSYNSTKLQNTNNVFFEDNYCIDLLNNFDNPINSSQQQLLKIIYDYYSLELNKLIVLATGGTLEEEDSFEGFKCIGELLYGAFECPEIDNQEMISDKNWVKVDNKDGCNDFCQYYMKYPLPNTDVCVDRCSGLNCGNVDNCICGPVC